MKKDDMALLPKLGIAIDTSLATWESYTETLADQPTYESIISTDLQDTSTKAKALLHLLDTLPSRHAALVVAYSDDKLEYVGLSDICTNLLEELQKPESDVELDSWFNRTLAGKKSVTTVVQLEKDIRSEEQGRLQELRRLKASQLALMSVYQDGELGDNEVEKLLDAMEEVGVHLGAAMSFDVAVGGSSGTDGTAKG